ncbi:hypothetical protein ABEB36_011681 [Hypothenemus hampei]|uniref:THAP-type domain-containing protein n=1 Tax=Hypothenemus hampei TaxID=57062 RepID=A0ABD1E8N3_HYPHA
MTKRGGTVCAVHGCLSRTTTKDTVLFRFPKDERAKRWIIERNREDIMHKTPIQLIPCLKILCETACNLLQALQSFLYLSLDIPIQPTNVERHKGDITSNIPWNCPNFLQNYPNVPPNCPNVLQDSSVPTSSTLNTLVMFYLFFLMDYDKFKSHIDIDENTALSPKIFPRAIQTTMSLTLNSPRKENNNFEIPIDDHLEHLLYANLCVVLMEQWRNSKLRKKRKQKKLCGHGNGYYGGMKIEVLQACYFKKYKLKILLDLRISQE